MLNVYYVIAENRKVTPRTGAIEEGRHTSYHFEGCQAAHQLHVLSVLRLCSIRSGEQSVGNDNYGYLSLGMHSI